MLTTIKTRYGYIIHVVVPAKYGGKESTAIEKIIIYSKD
jgi:hypothetical protein